MRISSWLGLFIVGVIALGQQRSFISCPIVRDTQTSPCFLAEHDGELYYLGSQQDSSFNAPQLKHEVLVEGRVVQGPKVCGGIPLQPVAVSVLKEVNLACNTLLPAEPGIEAPPLSRSRSESAGTPRGPLSGKQEFTVLYAFNDDDLESSAERVIEDAAAYAKRIGASSVKVSGYRATSVLSSGDHLVEKAGLAEKRAQNIATLLRGLGVSNVSVESKADPDPGDGLTDPSRRRVTILVSP